MNIRTKRNNNVNIYFKSYRRSGLGDVLKRNLIIKTFAEQNKNLVQGYIKDPNWLKMGLMHVDKWDYNKLDSFDIKDFEEYFKKNYFDLTKGTIEENSIVNPTYINAEDIIKDKKKSFKKNLKKFYKSQKNKNIIITFYSTPNPGDCLGSQKIYKENINLTKHANRYRKINNEKKRNITIHMRQADTSILRYENELIYKHDFRGHDFYHEIIKENKTIWEYFFTHLKEEHLRDREVIICSDFFDNERKTNSIRKDNTLGRAFSDEEWEDLIQKNRFKLLNDMKEFKRVNNIKSLKFISGNGIEEMIGSLDSFRESMYVISNRPSSGLLWLNELVYNTKIIDVNNI